MRKRPIHEQWAGIATKHASLSTVQNQTCHLTLTGRRVRLHARKMQEVWPKRATRFVSSTSILFKREKNGWQIKFFLTWDQVINMLELVLSQVQSFLRTLRIFLVLYRSQVTSCRYETMMQCYLLLSSSCSSFSLLWFYKWKLVWFSSVKVQRNHFGNMSITNNNFINGNYFGFRYRKRNNQKRVITPFQFQQVIATEDGLISQIKATCSTEKAAYWLQNELSCLESLVLAFSNKDFVTWKEREREKKKRGCYFCIILLAMLVLILIVRFVSS